jgi:hypothetical protein
VLVLTPKRLRDNWTLTKCWSLWDIYESLQSADYTEAAQHRHVECGVGYRARILQMHKHIWPPDTRGA